MNIRTRKQLAWLSILMLSLHTTIFTHTAKASPMKIEFDGQQQLKAGNQIILKDIPDSVSVIPDKSGTGVFIKIDTQKPAARHEIVVGAPLFKRFMACHRYEPFWMRPEAGNEASKIPVETQSLITELDDGTCALYIPLIDKNFRAALQGGENGYLKVVCESNDSAITTTSMIAFYVAADSNPYRLVENAAEVIKKHLNMGRLRKDKPHPDFMDIFGWCTWDAFYQEVSLEKVRLGLQTFKDGGIIPRYIILDDGWQSVKLRDGTQNERRLTAFQANTKFPGGLRPTVEMAKNEFGLQTFIVWHAMTGYWGGVDPETFPQYDIRIQKRTLSPGIAHYYPNGINWWGADISLVAPNDIYRFFHDYHRHLREQGVDGVKVDTQSSLEMVAQGLAGRIQLMRTYREALEGSMYTQFKGNLINCMSCANDVFFTALNSNLTRTSTDFWPRRPESHGLHLYTNAQVCLFFGEFTWGDWDMFQSGHEMGVYHAAGRAVSGGPVYVSDKTDGHNFDVLKTLVMPDGSILRAQQPGKPTRDCLFADVMQEPVLLKIFNRNAHGAIVGAFNARYDKDNETEPVTGTISPSDVPGFGDGVEKFAVYAFNAKKLMVLPAGTSWQLTLPQLKWELFTIVPIEKGLAPIGLPEMLNSSGAVLCAGTDVDGSCRIKLRPNGKFLLYAQTQPKKITVDNENAKFNYDPDSHALNVDIPFKPVPVVVRIYNTH